MDPTSRSTNSSSRSINVDNSDAIIKGSAELDSELSDYFDAADKPKLDYHSIEEFADPYTQFYQNEVLG